MTFPAPRTVCVCMCVRVCDGRVPSFRGKGCLQSVLRTAPPNTRLLHWQKNPGCLRTTFSPRPPPNSPQLHLDGGVCSVAQSCLKLCDPVDCSPPGSSVHVISQAEIQEWIAISFSRGSSRPRDQTLVSGISR